MSMQMPDKKTWGLVAAGAAVVALLVWAFTPRPLEVEAATVTQGRFEQAVEEDGRTRLRERYTVSAPVAAHLARITLREGDRVQAGDPVAVLTPVMSSMVDERSAREAGARLQAAGAGLTRAVARVERARIALDEARLDQERTERLAQDGFVSPARLDATRLALAGARRELDIAQAERQMAVHEQTQAAAALEPASLSGRSGRPLLVRSPVAGAVLRVVQPSEATIAAGAALLEVGEPAQMEVVSELLTSDAVQAQPGRRVVIGRWGGQQVEGRVRRVEPAAFTKVSALGIEEQRVNVLIDITETPDAWRSVGDGFRVGVRIVTASVESAVLVPVGALFPHEKGTAVYRIEGNRARLQPVELGARNASEAWVRSGLQPGQAVVVYPAAAVADGRRLHVRRP